jgi:hypothetical protein
VTYPKTVQRIVGEDHVSYWMKHSVLTRSNKDLLFAEVKVPERQTEQRVVIGGESNGFASVASRLSPEMLHKFDGKSKKVSTSNVGTASMSLKFLFGKS